MRKQAYWKQTAAFLLAVLLMCQPLSVLAEDREDGGQTGAPALTQQDDADGNPADDPALETPAADSAPGTEPDPPAETANGPSAGNTQGPADPSGETLTDQEPASDGNTQEEDPGETQIETFSADAAYTVQYRCTDRLTDGRTYTYIYCRPAPPARKNGWKPSRSRSFPKTRMQKMPIPPF